MSAPESPSVLPESAVAATAATGAVGVTRGAVVAEDLPLATCVEPLLRRCPEDVRLEAGFAADAVSAAALVSAEPEELRHRRQVHSAALRPGLPGRPGRGRRNRSAAGWRLRQRAQGKLSRGRPAREPRFFCGDCSCIPALDRRPRLLADARCSVIPHCPDRRTSSHFPNTLTVDPPVLWGRLKASAPHGNRPRPSSSPIGSIKRIAEL